MKYLATIFSLVALIALVPALVVADDGESNDDDWSGDRHHPHRPPPTPPTQVLWGQCGGYYYTGTNVCPEGAYCRYFSDWYSQCNLKGQ